jgi:NhaP-type Na+/H+ or K+/H+ antiporter
MGDELDFIQILLVPAALGFTVGLVGFPLLSFLERHTGISKEVLLTACLQPVFGAHKQPAQRTNN